MFRSGRRDAGVPGPGSGVLILKLESTCRARFVTYAAFSTRSNFGISCSMPKLPCCAYPVLYHGGTTLKLPDGLSISPAVFTEGIGGSPSCTRAGEAENWSTVAE